jgi:hypothetical protein
MTTTSTLPDVGIQLREGYVDVGDQSLHYVEAGDGPLIVLLHGFPEFWFGWRLQIEPLAAAGFRVVAPDTRGYNLSSKPEGFKDYAVDLLADDIYSVVEERTLGWASVAECHPTGRGNQRKGKTCQVAQRSSGCSSIRVMFLVCDTIGRFNCTSIGVSLTVRCGIAASIVPS